MPVISPVAQSLSPFIVRFVKCSKYELWVFADLEPLKKSKDFCPL